jgi:hypothetical protein
MPKALRIGRAIRGAQTIHNTYSCLDACTHRFIHIFRPYTLSVVMKSHVIFSISDLAYLYSIMLFR